MNDNERAPRFGDETIRQLIGIGIDEMPKYATFPVIMTRVSATDLQHEFARLVVLIDGIDGVCIDGTEMLPVAVIPDAHRAMYAYTLAVYLRRGPGDTNQYAGTLDDDVQVGGYFRREG